MTLCRLVIYVETELTGLQAAEHVGALINASPMVELAWPVYYRPWEYEDAEPDYSAPEPVKGSWFDYTPISKAQWLLISIGIFIGTIVGRLLF